MKNMTFLAIIYLTLVNAAHAQRPKFGVHIGNSFSSYRVSFESVSIISRIRAGYTLGIVTDIPAGSNFSIMPGLNYVQKGGRIKSGQAEDIQITNYVELPLNVLCRIRSGDGKIVFGGGPSVSAGVSGKQKWEAEGASGSEKITFGSGPDKDLKTVEAGINMMAGFIGGDGFMLTLSYNFGLSDLATTNDYSASYRNRYFGLRVGYMISN